LAVLAAGILYLFISDAFRLSEVTHCGYPLLLVVFLAVLMIGTPAASTADHRSLGCAAGRRHSSGGRLHEPRGAAHDRRAVGWITNIIAFALWYWHLDSHGPATRASGRLRTQPAFRFPEQGLPDVAGAGWYPQFVDHLALSFNTSTAFGPTDVSASRQWSKLMLIVEALISLTSPPWWCPRCQHSVAPCAERSVDRGQALVAALRLGGVWFVVGLVACWAPRRPSPPLASSTAVMRESEMAAVNAWKSWCTWSA